MAKSVSDPNSLKNIMRDLMNRSEGKLKYEELLMTAFLIRDSLK